MRSCFLLAQRVNPLFGVFSSYFPLMLGKVFQSGIGEFYPAVEFLSAKTTPCVGYSTATDMPYIAPVAAGVYVAIAQGAAAKSTDELGLIAARMLAHGTWDYDMPPEEFAVRYAE